MKRKTTIIVWVTALVVGALLLGLTIFLITTSHEDIPPGPAPVAQPAYVFELVRHGARAPLMSASDFPVDAQMLTPQGMRQRYLLGRYNAEKYKNIVKHIELIDIESTDFYRTI